MHLAARRHPCPAHTHSRQNGPPTPQQFATSGDPSHTCTGLPPGSCLLRRENSLPRHLQADPRTAFCFCCICEIKCKYYQQEMVVYNINASFFSKNIETTQKCRGFQGHRIDSASLFSRHLQEVARHSVISGRKCVNKPRRASPVNILKFGITTVFGSVSVPEIRGIFFPSMLRVLVFCKYCCSTAKPEPSKRDGNVGCCVGAAARSVLVTGCR